MTINLEEVSILECYNRKMIRAKTTFPSTLFAQVGLAVGSGLLAFFLVFVLINAAISLAFSGRIMPGVAMNGLPLAGMKIEEATSVISSSYRFPESGSIVLVDAENSWVVRPVQLGFYLDPLASANNAYNVGRKGNLLEVLLQRTSMFKQEVPVQPSFIFDQKTAVNYLNDLAMRINQPVKEASISIIGTQVIVENGQQGRVLDVSASLDSVTRQIQSMQDGVVPLVVRQADPVILNAEAQGELARSVLSQPLTLTILDPNGNSTGSFDIQPADLATLLQFEKVDGSTGAQFQIAVNNTLMSGWMNSKKIDLERTPENPRFQFKDETGLLKLEVPAVIGRSLDVEGSIAAINSALQNGAHTADLSFNFINPPVTDQMTGAELGITELVQEYTSYFAGSDSKRIQNIDTASKKFYGLLVAPGETLSMSDVLGDISLDNGYAEALIILGDETIKGVGGGVCQVSTTLFRTAFFAGFQIVERHPHAYRVGYYEQKNSSGSHDSKLAGLDATVFVPLVDFKFSNDTPYWLLMETYVSPTYNSLTWKFYSTRDGREVSYDLSGVSNLVKPPDPVYRENPELSKGELKKVDYAVEGADVTVTRVVTRNGTTLYQDRFFTRYQPWGEVWEYGPGTEIPDPKPSS